MGVMVYFVRCLCGCAAIKIGASDAPVDRLQELQTSTPHRLQLLGHIFGSETTEFWLHERFWRERIIGEWFDKKIQKKIELILRRQPQGLKALARLLGHPRGTEKRRCTICLKIRMRRTKCECWRSYWSQTENIYLVKR
jgi:hypothetical protein